MSVVRISKEYMALVKRFLLRPIRDEKTLDLASKLYSELVLKGKSRTDDEEDYISILGRLIRDYEDEHAPKLAKPMSPKRALASLMEDNNLSQSELARKIHAPQSVISEFLSGKRDLSKSVIMRLADHFKVSPELFLPHSCISNFKG